VQPGTALFIATRRSDRQPTDNLARCRPVTASSSLPGSPAVAAVDGIPATAWVATLARAEFTVELAASAKVSSVVVLRGNPKPSPYSVQLSLDSEHWTTVADVPDLATGSRDDTRELTFAPTAALASLTALEPFYHERPWSRHLAGKRVLVVSPFAETIRRQYARREAVWRHKPEVLPAFELDTLRCPLSAELVKPVFPDWFTALDAMKEQMNHKIYDVLIIGAGAWSLPLVSHAKRQGKWAIHLGGTTQVLFGIRGMRWDDNPFLRTMYNECWVRPGPEDRPHTLKKIENGCYW